MNAIDQGLSVIIFELITNVAQPEIMSSVMENLNRIFFGLQ